MSIRTYKMLFTNQFYNEYQHDIFSQNGEDGIIAELVKRLNITDGWICEFGAWNGIHLSNTFNLVKSKKFNAIYIEGDARRFEDLLTTQKTYENITAINSYVNQDKADYNSLDNILSRTDIPYDFELLSIDIDGFDYQVWKSLEKYQPKIVIIEINSSVDPLNENHIHCPGMYEGTGFQPTLKLGVEKGYKFVLHTGNMFFVRNDLYEKLNMQYTDPLENFRTNWLSKIL